MTIATSANKVVGRGNGATASFAYAFLIPNAASLAVIYTDAAGVQTTLLPSQYTVTGLNNPAGGAVTYPLAGPPIALNTSITILRQVPYTQPTSLVNQASYSPAAVEGALDWLEMQIQQAVGIVNQGIVYPAVDVNPVNTLPPAAARAGKFFAFDGNGNPAMLPGNNLAGDLLAYTLGGAVFTNPYFATINSISINAGWYIEFNTALAAVVQGFSAHIERTAGANPNYLVGGMLSIQNRNGVTSDAFGIVTEVINQPGATGAVVGSEFAAVNQTNNNVNAKIGTNVVFKDRGDGVATVTQGLGANEYNLGAMGLFISSQNRSTAGEFCGWRRGVHFDEFAVDADANGGGIGIDFAKVHYFGGTNPLTAFRMTAALRLRDYQSILWNGDPTLPNDPTEPATNAVRLYFASAIAPSGRLILTTAGVEKFGIDVSTGDIYKAGVLVTGASTAGNNTWTGTNTFNNTFTLGTDLVMSGARKFTGDFSNATVLSRTLFQSNVVNGSSDLVVLPNGTNPNSSINFFNSLTPANSAYLHVAIGNTVAAIQSIQAGAAAALPLAFYVCAAGGPEGMRLSYPNQQLLINTAVESSVTGAKLRVNGIVQIDNAVAFRVYLSAAVLVPNAAFTQIPFNTKSFDQNNSFNTGTSRFTPPAGKYQLTGVIGCSGVVDTARIAAYLYKNGAIEAGMNNLSGGTAADSAIVSAVVDANGTDYFELFCYQTGGVNYTISALFYDTYFCGFRIG